MTELEKFFVIGGYNQDDYVISNHSGGDYIRNKDIFMAGSKAVINYIENDAEIAIPIDEFFDSQGNNITKKEYGKILLKYLVVELKDKFL